MRIVPAFAAARAASVECARWPTGIASLDAALAGGLAFGRVHEVHAADVEDAAAAAGFTMALATAMGKGSQPCLWLRSRRDIAQSGIIQANGWAELGGQPADGIFGIVPDNMALLRAAVDALRHSGLGAVIVESWGRMPELALTASRRLALATERSGVPLLLLRIDAAPVPSAAQTRWQVSAAPSQALPAHAPGQPCFNVTLLRQRSGPCGLSWRLEWDRDRCQFSEAPLPGAVVSVPVRRPAADTGDGSPRPDTRHAA